MLKKPNQRFVPTAGFGIRLFALRDDVGGGFDFRREVSVGVGIHFDDLLRFVDCMRKISMKRVTWLWIMVIGGVLAGCGGLQETWEGPGAARFHPKSIAVLPPIIGSLEGSRDLAHEVVTHALKRSKRYPVVIEPEYVNGVLINSIERREVFAGYLSRLETAGLSDKEAATKLGRAFGADALLIVRVNAWEYTRLDGDNVARVSMGFRLVDTRHGAIVWKGKHEKREGYIFFKPDLRDLATDLAEYMIKYIPR